MKCVKCGKKSQVKVQNLDACKSCFLKILQKRVRKEIRINQLIKKNDKILIIDDGSAESKSAIFILPKILKDLPVNIEIKKKTYNIGEKISENYNKIIIPWNADKEGEYFLSCVFHNKEMLYLGHFEKHNKNYLKIFLPVLEKEVQLYAEINKLDFKKTKRNSVEEEFLDKLEKKYPEIKFSLLRSADYFSKKE